MFFFDFFIVGFIFVLISLLKGFKIKLQCKIVGLLSNIFIYISVVYVIVDVGGILVLINLLVFDEFELYFCCVVILYDIV